MLGTMALEMIEQCPDVDAIIVPTGGAGLLAGNGKSPKLLKISNILTAFILIKGIAVAAKSIRPDILIIVITFSFMFCCIISRYIQPTNW